MSDKTESYEEKPSKNTQNLPLLPKCTPSIPAKNSIKLSESIHKTLLSKHSRLLSLVPQPKFFRTGTSVSWTCTMALCYLAEMMLLVYWPVTTVSGLRMRKRWMESRNSFGNSQSDREWNTMSYTVKNLCSTWTTNWWSSNWSILTRDSKIHTVWVIRTKWAQLRSWVRPHLYLLKIQ
jgi:hypothetical protein